MGKVEGEGRKRKGNREKKLNNINIKREILVTVGNNADIFFFTQFHSLVYFPLAYIDIVSLKI